MSTASTSSDGHTLLPTVTRRYLPHPDGEMNVFGWLLFSLLLVLLLPLLPFVALVWVVAKLGERMRS